MCDIHGGIDNYSVFFVVVIPAVDVKRPRKHPSLPAQAPISLMIGATSHVFPYFCITIFPTDEGAQGGWSFLFKLMKQKRSPRGGLNLDGFVEDDDGNAEMVTWVGKRPGLGIKKSRFFSQLFSNLCDSG